MSLTFRELYLALDAVGVARGKRPLSLTGLLPWPERLSPLLVHLRPYMSVNARLLPNKDIREDLWHLYALSRVNDYLLWPFQPAPIDGYLYVPATQLSLADYCIFWKALGMQMIEPLHFYPFWCEVIEVIPSENPDEPVTIFELHWPAMLFGSLLISRAGVTVRGGRNQIRSDVAPQSTLYFTYQRRYRRTSDLSMGWATSSQWRTAFRRDYVDDLMYYYNVDGTIDILLSGPNQNRTHGQLSFSERYELLVNRCFIVSTLPDSDLWPYDDTATEARRLSVNYANNGG